MHVIFQEHSQPDWVVTEVSCCNVASRSATSVSGWLSADHDGCLPSFGSFHCLIGLPQELLRQCDVAFCKMLQDGLPDRMANCQSWSLHRRTSAICKLRSELCRRLLGDLLFDIVAHAANSGVCSSRRSSPCALRRITVSGIFSLTLSRRCVVNSEVLSSRHTKWDG